MGRKLQISFDELYARALKEGIHNGREMAIPATAVPAALTIAGMPPTEQMIVESITLSVEGGSAIAQFKHCSGPDNGSSSTSKRILLQDGGVITIPLKFVTPAGFVGSIGLSTIISGTPQLRGIVNGIAITADLNFNADKVIMWIGDSVSRGTSMGGTTFNDQNWTAAVNPFDHFSFQVRNHFQRRGYDVRLINKSMGSYKSTDATALIKFGWYDVDQVDCIFYQMGINDTGIGTPTSNAVFNANLDAIIDYRDRIHPNAKVVFVGPSPLNNNTQETQLINFRSLMSARASVPSNIYYVSLESAFDRTVLTNYTSSDGIHPNIASNLLIGNVINNWITSNDFTL